MERGRKAISQVAVREAPRSRPIRSSCDSACYRRTPCRDIASAHEAKLELCDELEAIADGLPDRLDRRLCLIAAETLPVLVSQSHAYEEKYVFPAFQRNGANRAARRMTVKRLKMEHVEDECAAQDLADILASVGQGGPVDNPEALGFMLRAFFESMRRHIAFEREHVLPLVSVAQPARRS